MPMQPLLEQVQKELWMRVKSADRMDRRSKKDVVRKEGGYIHAHASRKKLYTIYVHTMYIHICMSSLFRRGFIS